MTESLATAPGKLILLGEYAVLDGGPAVVLAVDRRAQVRVVRGVDSSVLSAPEISRAAVPFSHDGSGAVAWHGIDPATAARLALMREVIARFGPAEPVRIETDTAAFQDGGVKLGLGSSAAVTVAAAAALAHGRPDLAPLVATHRAAQDGRGSGCDIAASLAGGAVLYRADPPEALPLALPADLQLRFVWTGRSASTPALLRELDAADRRGTALAALRASAETAVAGLDHRAGSWIAGMRDFAAALEAFARDTGLPVYAGGHDSLAETARRCGVVYKPSGAGGGDLGLVVGEDPEAMQAFAAALREPVRLLSLSPAARGLTLR